jgi:hypothetical protein
MHFSKLLFSLVVGIPAASLLVLATPVPDIHVSPVGPAPTPNPVNPNPGLAPTPLSKRFCFWPLWQICDGKCDWAPLVRA